MKSDQPPYFKQKCVNSIAELCGFYIKVVHHSLRSKKSCTLGVVKVISKKKVSTLCSDRKFKVKVMQRLFWSRFLPVLVLCAAPVGHPCFTSSLWEMKKVQLLVKFDALSWQVWRNPPHIVLTYGYCSFSANLSVS